MCGIWAKIRYTDVILPITSHEISNKKFAATSHLAFVRISRYCENVNAFPLQPNRVKAACSLRTTFSTSHA